MKKEKFFKKYSCPFCQLTSTRRYNLDVHIKRKHPQQQSQKEIYPPYTSTNLYQYNKHLYKQPRQLLDSNNFISEPTQIQSYKPTFIDNSYFEYLENQKKQEKRGSKRKYYQMINEFMSYLAILNNRNNNNIDIPIPYSTFSFYSNIIPMFSQFSYIPNFIKFNRAMDTNSYIDPNIMPIAHKIYLCKICKMETLLPIFDFDNITSLEKFEHKCIDSSFKHFNETVEDHDDYYSSNLQELLVSLINSRISSEKIMLEAFIIQEIIIQNPLFFILEIIQNIFDVNFIPKWIFKLLKVEKVIDLGEIEYTHWANRAYKSKQSITLERRELYEFVKTLNATFGLLTFKENKVRNFLFCQIPFPINKIYEKNPL